MKLIKFKNGLMPMEANLVSIGKNTHFNISHGTRLKGGWSVTFGVSDQIVQTALSSGDYMVELDSHDYILLPIYDFGGDTQKLDARGNKKYFVSRNQSEDDSSVLLFLNLPNVIGCSYKISGMGRVISMGKTVMHDETESHSIEAPIILLEGDTIILVKYELNGEKHEERIVFKNKQLQYIKG